MTHIDRSIINWRQSRENKDPWSDGSRDMSSRAYRRKVTRDLDSFAIGILMIDKKWWSILNLDEKSEVKLSYYNTSEMINRKEDRYTYWSNRQMYIADVDGDNWEPQWFEYISEIFPKDPAVRRELAIQRIFS